MIIQESLSIAQESVQEMKEQVHPLSFTSCKQMS